MNLQRKFHFFSKKYSFFIYIIVNILLLSQFPFIHSDESWLSGLTREVFAVGEGTATRKTAGPAEAGVASPALAGPAGAESAQPATQSDAAARTADTHGTGSEGERETAGDGVGAGAAEGADGIDLTATEPFFDLLPRFPHFVKMLFHALQAPFIALFGYGPFAVRLLSLAAGCLALWFFSRAVGEVHGSVGMRMRALEGEPGAPLLLGSPSDARPAAARPTGGGSRPADALPLSSPAGTSRPAEVQPTETQPRVAQPTAAWPSISFLTAALLALDIQFIYAAHFGRQEILLVTALTAALWVYFREGQAASAPAGTPAGTPSCGGKNGESDRKGGEVRESRLTAWPAAGTPARHVLRGRPRVKGHRAAAMIIGLSIGIHPNSFLISLPIGAFLLVDVVAARSWTELGSALRRGLEYVAILAAWATLYVGLSYLLDPQFLYHYRSFGDRVGVVEPLYIKAFRFPDFYQKLFYQISGTYYTPAIKVQFYLFGAALAAAPIAAFVARGGRGRGCWLGRWRGRGSETAPLKGTPAGPGAGRMILQLPAALLLLNIGTLVLGKYSQPSIILHFPLYYLLIGLELAVLAERLGQPGQKAWIGNRRQLGKLSGLSKLGRLARILTRAVPAALIILTAANSAYNIGQELHLLSPKSREYYETYAEYGHNLHKFVPANTTVLANLNAEYHFGRGRLYDYRNLEYLDEAGLSFAEYIEKNSIEYIVYPEEMDLIYQQRPVWNILYGNVAAYYEDMQQFLAANCRPVGSFESPIYGMRITRYMGREPWRVQVYKIIR